MGFLKNKSLFSSLCVLGASAVNNPNGVQAAGSAQQAERNAHSAKREGLSAES
jgi:hypothetical protein